MNDDRAPEGMTEVDAVRFIVGDHHGTIASCPGAYPRPHTGGHIKVEGVLVTMRGLTVWAPSILDAAIVLRDQFTGAKNTPRLSG